MRQLVVLALLSFDCVAQNPQACTRCHGAQGEGGLTGAPPLAGSPREYLAAQLDAYAEGRRQHPVMTPIARGLTPAERLALADYFSHLTPRPLPPLLGRFGTTIVAIDRRAKKL